MFKIITSTIAKREHKRPSDIEEWCLPDITLIYSIYMEESISMDELEKEMKKNEPKFHK